MSAIARETRPSSHAYARRTPRSPDAVVFVRPVEATPVVDSAFLRGLCSGLAISAVLWCAIGAVVYGLIALLG